MQTLNAGDSAYIFRTKLNSNFTEISSGYAPTNHASSDTTYGVGSSSAYGHIKVNANNGLAITNGVLSLSNGSTSSAGAIQLLDSYTSTSTNYAPTAAALTNGLATTVKTYWGSSNPGVIAGMKKGDIYIKIS